MSNTAYNPINNNINSVLTITNMPTHTVENNYNYPICLSLNHEAANGTNEFIKLNCNHAFHRSCMLRSVSNNIDTCPVCRASINN